MLRLVCLGALASAAGCTLVYDFGSLEPTDASVPPPDIDPSALLLERLEPAAVEEGAGCVPEGGGCAEGSPAVPIVIHGSDIAQDAVVTLTGAGFEDLEVPLEVSVNADLAAFTISVPVDLELGGPDQAGSRSITVTVTQAGGTVSRDIELTVNGLPELALTGADPALEVAAADFAPRYSRIDLGGGEGTAIRFIGGDDEPVRLIATAISFDTALLAGGGAASATAGGSNGPGGCGGGDAANAGRCPEGGGGVGVGGGGGGGGGHAGEGGPGAGGDNGGGAVGDPALSRIAGAGDAAISRGHGGGGGFSVSSNDRGGGGGGGGGVVELTALALGIGPAARIESRGGDGAPPPNACGCLLVLCPDEPGSGGGGGGGAVLVRARHSFDDSGAGERIDVAGGARGERENCAVGGIGADGRVRIDVAAADGELPLTASPGYQGPVLAPEVEAIVRDPVLEATIVGAASQGGYFVEVERSEQGRLEISTASDRSGTASVDLIPGLNRVCAVVDAETGLSVSEGVNCRHIAYIPR
jgi:hypothetical protein